MRDLVFTFIGFISFPVLWFIVRETYRIMVKKKYSNTMKQCYEVGEIIISEEDGNRYKAVETKVGKI